MTVKFYDISKDEYVEATQQDVDGLQKHCINMGKRNRIVRAVTNINIENDKLLTQLANILGV